MSEELTLVIPKDVLEQCLRKVLNNDRLMKFHGTVVTKPPLKGQHFVSIVEYVEASVTSRGKDLKLHYFLKRAVHSEFHQQMLAVTQLMVKEDRFYNVLLPDYQAYVKTGIPRVNLDFIPKPIYVKDDVVLLENLVKTYNFKMSPFTMKGQNLHQAKMALTALAKFHAISYAMKQDEKLKEKYDFLDNTMFSTAMNEVMGKMLTSMFGSMIEVLQHDQKYRQVYRNFHELTEYIFGIGKETTIPEEPLNVICHGDCWNNNMMYHYEDEESDKPDDIRLLDFQVIRYVPLTCDLLYFICSSTSPQFREKHIQELLRFYYGQFFNTLTSFRKQNTCFPYEVLEKDYRKRRLLGLVFSVPMLIQCIIPKESMPEAEDMNADSPNMWPEMFKDLSDNDHARDVIGGHMTDLFNEVKDDVIAYLEKKREEKKAQEEEDNKEKLEEEEEEDGENKEEDIQE